MSQVLRKHRAEMQARSAKRRFEAAQIRGVAAYVVRCFDSGRIISCMSTPMSQAFIDMQVAMARQPADLVVHANPK